MKSFKNITGNDFIIKFLKNSIVHNRVSHAYIISGYEGVGKTLIAEMPVVIVEVAEVLKVAITLI